MGEDLAASLMNITTPLGSAIDMSPVVALHTVFIRLEEVQLSIN